MKRFRTHIIIIFIGLVLMICSPVSAQTTYEQLQDNYRFSLDAYKQALDEYNFARAEYLKYNTQVSKDLAIQATKKFLNSRQQVLVNYLLVIKERLEQSPELTEVELKDKILWVNEEIKFLETNQPLFDSAEDLDDLVKLSSQIEKRNGKYLAQSYRMKGLVIISKVRSLRKTALELINLANEQVARLKKEGIVNTTDIDRWLLEAPRKILLSETKETESIEKFAKLSDRANSTTLAKFFGTLQNDLRNSAQYLKEANDLLFEIVHKIRFT